MNPEQVEAALAASTAKMKAAASIDRSSLLMSNIEAISAAARHSASSAGDSIGIKVMQSESKVQVVVTGRNAAKYRSLIRAALRAQLPSATAEIKAQIIGKSR